MHDRIFQLLRLALLFHIVEPVEHDTTNPLPPFHTGNLSINLSFLLLLHLQQERSVDVWQDTAEGNGGSDQSVELLVASNGELKMTGRDTLDFEILGGVACEFENFSGEVFENGSDVDGGWEE